MKVLLILLVLVSVAWGGELNILTITDDLGECYLYVSTIKRVPLFTFDGYEHGITFEQLVDVYIELKKQTPEWEIKCYEYNNWERE